MNKDDSLFRFELYLQRRFPERRAPVDYLSDIRQFMATCQKPWRDVTMFDVDAFVDQQRAQGRQPATVHRRVAALKTFFDFLAEDSGDLSWPNPVRFKRHAGKRPRHLPRELPDEDIQTVWGVIGSTRDRAWFALMVRAGLRVGEVIDLKMDDLLSKPEGDRPGRLRVCGKGRKERVVWLTADAFAVLDAWLQERPVTEERHVFLNSRRKPLTASGIQWLLHGYARQVGMDLTPHQLRHTFARQVTEAGMPVTSLGKLLGHAQITTTQIYTAAADPDLSQAYQKAMNRLQQGSPPPPPPPMVAPVVTTEPEPTPPSPTTASEKPEPKLPDWEAWEVLLPEAIRQASLDYVKRHLNSWPASRRRARALNLLSELKHLWNWFIERRPITQPGQLVMLRC